MTSRQRETTRDRRSACSHPIRPGKTSLLAGRSHGRCALCKCAVTSRAPALRGKMRHPARVVTRGRSRAAAAGHQRAASGPGRQVTAGADSPGREATLLQRTSPTAAAAATTCRPVRHLPSPAPPADLTRSLSRAGWLAGRAGGLQLVPPGPLPLLQALAAAGRRPAAAAGAGRLMHCCTPRHARARRNDLQRDVMSRNAPRTPRAPPASNPPPSSWLFA